MSYRAQHLKELEAAIRVALEAMVIRLRASQGTEVAYELKPVYVSCADMHVNTGWSSVGAYLTDGVWQDKRVPKGHKAIPTQATYAVHVIREVTLGNRVSKVVVKYTGGCTVGAIRDAINSINPGIPIT